MSNNKAKKMLIIGLTGPSGAGKGTVSRLFEPYNIHSIDTDAVYHQLLIPPSPCLDELREEFGDGIISPDGGLDRRALADTVFSKGNGEKLERLNKITHRYVLDVTRNICREYEKKGCPAAIVDAPLLFESGFDSECDFTVSVLADRELRLERIIQRDGISKERALARLDAQKEDSFYTERSDEVIYNGSDIESLRDDVRRILISREVIPS